MRMARREGSLADFATDSVTSPDKIASRGITVPLTRVAMISLACILVPTGVLPAAMFCRMITGNSVAARELGGAGFFWLNNAVERTAASTTFPASFIFLNISVRLIAQLARSFHAKSIAHGLWKPVMRNTHFSAGSGTLIKQWKSL